MPNDDKHDHDHPHDHDHDHAHEDEAPDPELQAGWEALEAGNVEAARTAARAAIADKDRLLDGLLLDAACAREEGDVKGALASLTRAAAEDDEWCTPELWMGELLSEDPERGDEALRHARRALDLAEEEDEYLGALSLKAAIELDLGRPTEARKTLEGLPPADVPLEDPVATLDVVELLMDAGDVEQARVRLTTLTTAEPELAEAWYLLGACAELLDDEAGKRAAWVKTRELDLRDAPAAEDESEQGEGEGKDGPSLTEDELVAVAEATLASFPENLRSLLSNVPIVVAEVPAAADVATGLDPRLLGLFSGTPHAEAGGVMGHAQLTEILLFRRNLERAAPDEETLREEVRVTLLHEAGHFFGLDEAALTRLGLD